MAIRKIVSRSITYGTIVVADIATPAVSEVDVVDISKEKMVYLVIRHLVKVISFV